MVSRQRPGLDTGLSTAAAAVQVSEWAHCTWALQCSSRGRKPGLVSRLRSTQQLADLLFRGCLVTQQSSTAVC